MNHKIISEIPSGVNIIAVTKGRGEEEIIALKGFSHFGENRIEEIEQKWSSQALQNLLKNSSMHFIGRLSGKKIKRIVKCCDYIHSLSDITHLHEINKQAGNAGKIINCFIQVNISGEESKSGITADELSLYLEVSQSMTNAKIIGLMTMAPLHGDAYAVFRELKKLADEYKITNLSMGMSNDYNQAIECGATFIRIGSKLFS